MITRTGDYARRKMSECGRRVHRCLYPRSAMSPGEVLLESFDRMSCAGLLLDSSGRVRRFNSFAECLLGMRIGCGTPRLEGNNDRATRALRSLLDRKLVVSHLIQAPAVVMSRLERPVVAQAISLPRPPDQEAEAVLVLFDLNSCPRPCEETLRRVFGLTKTEAKLAARLACGESLQDITEELGIGIGTGRMHLKGIFSKTHTCRQAELVALLCRLALLPRPASPATPDVTARDPDIAV